MVAANQCAFRIVSFSLFAAVLFFLFFVCYKNIYTIFLQFYVNCMLIS